MKKVKQFVKQISGGGAWESNPPETLTTPPDGFEVTNLASKLLTNALATFSRLEKS